MIVFSPKTSHNFKPAEVFRQYEIRIDSSERFKSKLSLLCIFYIF